MTRWEKLERYLSEHKLPGQSFTSIDYSTATKRTRLDATTDIQAYLDAQRSVEARTLYVLKREPGTRTSNARWSVGVRTRDARRLGKQFASDVHRQAMRAFKPDLVRLAVLNPHAAKKAESMIESVIDGALKVLEHAVNGIDEP
jgi:hypothetical protein